MKKSILILLLSVASIFSFGQKKQLYVNDDLNYISKTEFENKLDHPHGYNLRFDLDSCYLSVKFSRYKKGQLEFLVLDSIKKKLCHK